MTPWQRYQALMTEHPALFRNDAGGSGIRIVSDERTILDDQRRHPRRIPQAAAGSETGEEPIGIGVLVEDPWVWVVRDWVEFASGLRGGYIRVINRKEVDGGSGVVVLAARGDEVLLLRQYRHALRDWVWEVPRGFGEPGLTAEENARKELREEAGLEAVSLTSLGSCVPDSGMSSARATCFFARLDPAAVIPARTGEADEAIDGARFVDLKELELLIAQGTLSDAFTLAAVAKARIRGLLPR